MRRLFTALALLLCSVALIAQHNVTFQVDMNSYAGTINTGVYVNGSWNNWCGSCNPLTDANLDGIWEGTISIPAGEHEFKFTVDGWNAQELFAQGDPCTLTDPSGQFTNRALIVNGDLNYGPVAFNDCYGASGYADSVMVMVYVNMANTTPGDTAYITGGSGWGAPGDYPLVDPDANGVYTGVFLRDTGFTSHYTFVNDLCPNYSCKENIAGQACADPSNFNDRFPNPPFMADTIINTCFGECTSDGSCTPLAQPTKVVFRVDMNPYSSANSFGFVNLSGSLNGWCGDCEKLSDPDGDGIWTDTVELQAGTYEYKFSIDNWADQENFDPNTDDSTCTLTTGAFTNRIVTVGANDTTLNLVCFAECTPCAKTGPPVYDIATVTAVDANGEPDSAGVLCELRGVVTSVNFSNNPRLEFFFQDATGGIGLFESNNDYGYNPVTIGDSVHVQGTIGQFRGLIQINPDTVMVMGQGTVPAPKEVTMLDESTEGELIHLSNVRLADPSQWPSPGQSRNVDIVVCNDTLLMRIDSNTEVDDSVSAPTGTFNLTGIGSQFDFSSPYLEGYQVFPRIVSDIMPVASHIISDYKDVDGNGEADSLNADVVFEGVVTSVDYDGNSGVLFYMQDATAGIALFNFADVDVNGSPYQVMMGDELRVHGSIDQFRGLTQVFVDSIEVLCQGKMLPMPTVVDSLGEFTEGHLIRINGAELVDASQWPSPGSNASVDIKVGMDTLVLRIDRDTEVDDSVSAPSGTFDIIGVGSQFTFGPPFLDGYQIQPRVPADIIAAPSTVGVPCADLYFSEYIEGSSNNKCFEIYNPTQASIDLSNYTVELSGNGGSFLNSFVLDGMLMPGDVYVVCTDQADSVFQAQTDTALAFPSVAHFSGDDALYLLKGNDTLDIIGIVGDRTVWTVGSGSTQNHTLVRKSNVFNGTTNWSVSSAQWDVYASNFADSLGAHTQDDCNSAIIPDLALNPTAVDVLQYEGSTTIDVAIANPNNDTTQVEVFVRGGTATNGVDFNFVDTVVTFLPGANTPISLDVEIINQPGSQPNRTVVLGLRNATNNATISADSSVITIIDVPYYPIATVHGEDGDGVADSNGIFCELRGVVTTGIDFRGGNGLTFYITDPTGSINVFSFSDVSGYVVTEGDSLHIIGQIEQFRGLTEIIPDSIQVASTGNAIPTPRVVSTLDENTESELVQLYGWSFVDTMQWDNTSSSGFNVDVTNGTDTLVVRIDNDSELYGQSAPDPNKVYAITGLGSQFSGSSAPFLDGYQLFPRYLTDLEEILAPAADFSFATTQLDVDFTDLSTNDPTSWDWDFGDGNTSMDQNPSHTYAAGGQYQVCLTASNVAGSDQVCDSVTVIGVGIDNPLEASAGLEVFPNPTKGQLTLQSDDIIQSVTVINTNGQVVAARWIGDTFANLPLNVAAGTYLIVVNYEEGQLVRQIVKQ